MTKPKNYDIGDIMKRLLFLPFILIAVTAYAGTPIYSTKVDRSLSDMLDANGKWKRIFVSPGQEAQVRSDLGVPSSDSPTFTGTVTAAAFSGSGAGITDANNLRLKVGTVTYGKPVYTIVIDNTEHSLTGTTTRTAVKSVTIPGGVMGTSGVLWIDSMWSKSGTSSFSSAAAIYLGGTRVKVIGNDFAGTAPQTGRLLCELWNRGSTTSQISFQFDQAPYAATVSTAITTYSINTAIDQVLTFEETLTVATCTASLECCKIEIYTP